MSENTMASTSGNQPTQSVPKTYTKKLVEKLSNMYSIQKFTDVIVKTDGREFPCHRIVLSAASDYFEAMFNSCLRESTAKVVELNSVDAETMSVLLSYVYSGKIELTTENVQNLAQAADEFLFEELAADCELFMIKEMDLSNCAGFFRFARLYGHEYLLEKAETLMLKNFKEVVRSPDFVELSHEDLIDYISNCDLEVPTEDAVFEAACNWVKFDKEKRTEVFPQIAAHIRFPFCSETYLCVEVSPCIFMSHPDCQKYLEEARKYHLMPEQRHQMFTPRTQPRKLYPIKTSLVAFGGCLDSTNVNTACYFIEPNGTSWQAKPHISIPKLITVNAVAIRNNIFLTGVTNALSHHQSHSYLYDTGLRLWKKLSSMNKSRCLHGQVVHNKTVYVVGGITCLDPYTASKSVEMYSSDLKRWITIPDMPKPLAMPMTVSYGRYIYVFGGSQQDKSCSVSSFAYNTVWQKWEEFADIPQQIDRGGAAVFNDKTYVVGGFTQNCLSYNMALDTWTVLTSPRLQHRDGAVCVWKGKIIVIGGKEKTVEEYDIEKNEWCDSPVDFPVEVHNLSLICIDQFDKL